MFVFLIDERELVLQKCMNSMLPLIADVTFLLYAVILHSSHLSPSPKLLHSLVPLQSSTSVFLH